MSGPITVYIKRIPGEGLAQIPFKKHATDAGWDLYTSREQTVGPGRVKDIHTDIALGIPEGWFAQLVGRSSIVRTHGLVVVDAVIDQGYRGELFIQVQNIGPREARLPIGVRIAQLLFLPVPEVRWAEVFSLPASDRGHGGFGSTGV